MQILRSQAAVLASRLAATRRFIQIVAGPRQVGKTTLVQQVLELGAMPAHVVSADDGAAGSPAWISQHWDVARSMTTSRTGAVLVIDEVQKVPQWSTAVKAHWDADTRARCKLKVVLLGSSPLLLQHGLDESLAGRFEVIRMQQWSFMEMQAAFGWDLSTYLFHGGYPGAAPLIKDPARWRAYVRDALIEASIARDVLQLTRVDKPALLRRVFELGCAYSGQELSITKMLGQLRDAGNTTTVSGYADLLGNAGLLTALQKYSGHAVRRRASSPKWLVHDTALLTVPLGLARPEARRDGATWGRIVESAVGGHLLRAATDEGFELFYWRDGNAEVDFVIRCGPRVTAVEVKSGRPRPTAGGMAAFHEAHRPARSLLVGTGGIELDEFFARPASHWLA